MNWLVAFDPGRSRGWQHLRGGDARDQPELGVAPGRNARLTRRWLLLAALFALLALPLSIAAAGPNVLPGDVAIERAVQAPAWPWLDPLAWTLTTLGRAWPGETQIAVILVLLIWFFGTRRDAVFVALAALAGTLNVATKLIVASPRPPANLVRVLEVANGSGFPSGHAFGATLLYGAVWIVLPVVARNQWAARLLRIAAIAIALGIAWSRIRLGAHWPTDVLGGILWGMSVLALLSALVLPGRSSFTRLGSDC